MLFWYRSNTHCYLEAPEWLKLYASLAVETPFLTARSPLGVKLHLFGFTIPGLWHDVDHAINSPGFLAGHSLTDLEAHCRKAHAQLLDWIEDYKEHCVRLALTRLPATELAYRRHWYAMTLKCQIFVNRLMATICEADRIALEHDSQALANSILDLQKQPSDRHSWLFSGQELGFAYAVLVGRDNWEEDVSNTSPEEQRHAARRRYNAWSGSLRAEVNC